MHVQCQRQAPGDGSWNSTSYSHACPWLSFTSHAMTKESEEIAATAATVVVGTYDGGLLGFGLEDGVQRFGYAPHVGCVKAVHCTETGKLATGATDNSVRLFDLAKGVEMGELQEHEEFD
eukprot:symbB.v1.2.002040.t1/scaffold105.1/size328853/6